MQLCIHVPRTSTKRHVRDKIDSYMDKIWGINVSNLCVLLKYKVKQLEANYWLFNINIGYWNFENNRSINWLFGESAQH